MIEPWARFSSSPRPRSTPSRRSSSARTSADVAGIGRRRHARSGGRRRRRRAIAAHRAVRPPSLVAHGEQSGFAQRAVDVHGRADRRRCRTPTATMNARARLRARCLDERRRPRRRSRQVAGDGRMVRAQALQAVVEVRQVDRASASDCASPDVQRRIGDPARRGDSRRRAPELEQRKRPELCRELIAQSRGLRVAVGNLAAVGLVDRARRHRDVGGRRHVVPPEHVGAGEAPHRARLPASHTRSPANSRFDWRHSQISQRSRKSQPLPTAPCSRAAGR